MSLEFSHQILAAIWEVQIISAHHFYQYLPQSFLSCFWSLWRREERNPILVSLSLPTLLLNQCILHVFVTERGDFNVQKWAWRTVGLLLEVGQALPGCAVICAGCCCCASTPVQNAIPPRRDCQSLLFALLFGLQILSLFHVCGIYQLLLGNLNELKKCCPISFQTPLGKQI